jgi:phosphoribosylamine---glycine ligase
MNILLLGSGGREHAMAWKLGQSKKLSKLFIAPGNAGTSKHGENVSLSPLDFKSVGQFCLDNQIAMLIVGPEEPLVKGIRDYFENAPGLSHIPVIGPDAKGAMLEGSKDFAKDFMNKYDIPTARHFTATSTNIKKGIDFLKSMEPPYVLKADGLAAGKGVLILDNLEIAEKELKNILSGKFGNAGEKVVIEEFLSGIELSVFVLTDGKHYLILPEAKDYKRIGENDTGPNTGGMGSVSPVSFADKTFMAKVENRIIQPTITGLVNENIHYQGFVFFGLIKVNNDPYVIEYNCRMGDPETESVFPRIKNDFIELLEGITSQSLDKMNIETDPRFVSSIMLVSGGYPDSYEKGFPISGLETTENCIVFHAGTDYSENTVITNGGRVIAITCYGNSMKESLEKGLKNAEKINFSGKYFRRDIGFDLGKHN